MPQTAPLNWYIPLIITSLILTYTFMNNFLFHQPLKSSKNSKKSLKIFSYKW